MIKFFALIVLLFVYPTQQKNKKLLLLAEQSQHRIAIADVDKQQIIWEWSAASSPFIKPAHKKWFDHPDDVKPVYDGKYILITASGGGVALIRIADKKPVFYAYAGGNPHSAEVLSDGNIVSASSTGNFLTLFTVDTTVDAEQVKKNKMYVAFGHNVVWDAKNELLWTAAMDHMLSYRYNNNCDDPALIRQDSIQLPGTDAHDLFPGYGTRQLWLTNTTNVYRFDVATKKVLTAEVPQKNIKSVSSGPAGFPTIMILPKERWWTDEVTDTKGQTVFQQSGLKIYKARWLLKNHFSYPQRHGFVQCR
jgi:hypothetical protein